MRRLTTTLLITALLAVLGSTAVAAQSPSGDPHVPGPPYPDPVEGVSVYDYTGVLGEDTIAALEAAVAAIEEQSGAEVVVYLQVKPESDTIEESERDAAALMEQWGIGRTGADDGLAILFDLTEDRCGGQAQLYAGTGFGAVHMDHDERQAVFEEDMLPFLRQCDLDSALLAAMDRVDAATSGADTVAVEDLYPADLGVAGFSADDVDVLQGESDILDYIFGSDPDPAQIVGLMDLAAATGNTTNDMTLAWGGFESDSGDISISLAGIQIPGADTDALYEATRLWGLEMMNDPAYEELELAGKRVTVFDTEETLGSPNYLYAHDDIAWIFSTSEAYAADVLEVLPG